MNALPIVSRRSKHEATHVPPRKAWQGAALGAGVAVYAALTFLSTQLNTRLGTAADMLASLLAGLLLALVAGLVTVGLLALLRRVPVLWGGLVAGLVLALVISLVFTQPTPLLGVLGLVLAVPPALLGGAVGLGLQRGFRRLGVVIFLLGAVSLNAAGVTWLLWPGAPAHTVVQPGGPAVVALRAPHPAEPGGYEVRTLTYGSAGDRRPAYGAQATLRTEAVDGSPFLPDWPAFRTWHWGFDASSLPLNGRLWFPTGEGPFPLVLIVHGNHDMTTPSEEGYGYLGELLASRGYIVASVDENFLNLSWSGDFRGKEVAARAWLVLKHLEALKGFHTTVGNPLFRRIDLGHIGLVGHSRGGEAVALAAAFNNLSQWPDDANVAFHFRFRIRAVAAIAPVDGQYQPAGRPAPLENVSYLVLHGADDADVTPFMGLRPYQRVSFSDGGQHFRAGIYLHGANHGQFNTVWGRRDWSGLPGALIGTRRLMEGEAQRQAAKVFLSAFLEATLRERDEYRSFLRDPRSGAAWLPDVSLVSRFADSTLRPVSTFDEDLDLLTSTAPGGIQRAEGFTVWREERPELRRGVSAEKAVLRLGWEQEGAAFSIALPDNVVQEWRLGDDQALTFALADARPRADQPLIPMDLTVELRAADGSAVRLPLSRWAPVLLPQPSGRLYKLGALEEALLGPAAPPLQTYVLPLADFMAGTGFDPAKLRSVTLRFDRGAAGTVLLDDVGFIRVR